MPRPVGGEQSLMGQNSGRPLWAEATTNVLRACWPVLLPLAVAVLGWVLGAEGVFARTAPVLVVVAGSALLSPPRFAALCLTTLACAVATWPGPGLGLLGVVLAEAAITVPFVIAGRAMWVARGARRLQRLRCESTLIVRAAHLPGRPIQLDRSS